MSKVVGTFIFWNLPVMLPRTLLRACEKVYFHLVMPRHVFSPCYAQHEHTSGVKCYVTYYLAICEVTSAKHVILYVVTSAKHVVLYEVTSAKHAWVSLERCS